MTENNQTPQREPQSAPRPRKRRSRRRSPLGTVGKVVGTILLVGLTTGVLLACFAAVYVSQTVIPEAKEWVRNLSGGDTSISLTSTMYYTDGQGQEQEYLTLSSEENRILVKYSDIPEDLVNALIAIEDKRFLSHHGVDWLRTARGVLNMFTGGSIQGGSTITQQLIKNITGENQVTVKRKITEIFRALEFDKNYSKEQTLEWYLNYVYFGERSNGVGAASYAYFGKDVRELSLAQCASLVGITNNPSRYDPYLNKNAEVTNDAANRKRAKLVLKNMWEQKMISEEEYDAACAEVETMEFVRGSVEGGEPTKVYNWYQDQVITDVIRDLMEKYNWSEKAAARKVYYGGLFIYTNVDTRVQAIVDEIYSDPENLPYVSNSGQQMQSAIVVVDHRGRVVALSGGIGQKTLNRGWSRASTTKRPPGSSIKPLAVYGPAMEMGMLTPYSILDDSPYQEIDGNVWPGNAVGYYKGLDTVRHAVAQSSNTVAVRALGDYVTPQAAYDFLESKFHITSLVREKWINNKKFSDMDLAPLALGGLTNGVSVYEMAAAYAAFPSMGRYVPPRTYSKVVDADGVTVLLDHTQDGEYILKEKTAYYMNSMLKEVVTGGTGREAAIEGMTVAGKTGTTTSQKDLWFAGYTPYYTAAVWVGYDRQERLGGVGHPQTVLWNKVMSRVHEGLENKDFDLPSDGALVTADFCLDSGMKPGPLCAADVRGSRISSGTYVQGDEPKEVCTLHQEVRVCTGDPIVNEETGEATGGYRLAGEFCPEELVKTMSAINYVREGAAAKASVSDSGALLSRYTSGELCTVHTTEAPPEVTPFDPEDPTTWPVDDPLFDINDPATWPQVTPSEEPNGGEGPTEGPAESHVPTEEPQPAGPEGPAEGSFPPEGGEPATPPPASEEPFVPAGPPEGIPEG